MISLEQRQTLSAQWQRLAEESYPGSIVIEETEFACAKSTWRNRTIYGRGQDQSIEVREIVIHLRGELLTAAGIDVRPEQTSGWIDGVEVIIVDQDAGNEEGKFRMTCRAVGMEEPQM